MTATALRSRVGPLLGRGDHSVAVAATGVAALAVAVRYVAVLLVNAPGRTALPVAPREKEVQREADRGGCREYCWITARRLGCFHRRFRSCLFLFGRHRRLGVALLATLVWSRKGLGKPPEGESVWAT